MPKGANKFELTLNLQEVIVLFFVMVALFTGLLFFGYRVGNARNQNAVDLPLTPLAPAQEKPRPQPKVPAGVEIEPEIRLENITPDQLKDPVQAPARFLEPAEEGWLLLAEAASESPHGPCKADNYWSFLRQTLPSKHRFFERLADWAGVPTADDPLPGNEHPWDSNDTAANESTLMPNSRDGSRNTGCAAPVPRRRGHSVAC